MNSEEVLSLRVSDITRDSSKDSLIRLWSPVGRPSGAFRDTYPCNNHKSHSTSQCVFSHEYLLDYPLVRCRNCISGYCRSKDMCQLLTITDRAGISAKVYVACDGFVDRLKKRMQEQSADGMKRQREEAEYVPTSVIDETPPTAPAASVFDPPLKKHNSMVELPRGKASPSPPLLEKPSTVLAPVAKRPEVVPTFVYLPVDANTIEAIAAIIHQSGFEGMLKVTPRKLEDLATTIAPVHLLKFEKELVKINGTKNLLEIAKLKLHNEELQRQLAALKPL